MGWLLYAPVLPIGRLRRLAFLLSLVVLTVLTVAVLVIPSDVRWISLVLIWPQICLQARRLHDTGRSGFWLLLPWALGAVCLFCAAVGGVDSLVNSEPYPAPGQPPISASGLIILGFGLATVMIVLGWFLFLCIAPSSAKVRYGAPIA